VLRHQEIRAPTASRLAGLRNGVGWELGSVGVVAWLQHSPWSVRSVIYEGLDWTTAVGPVLTLGPGWQSFYSIRPDGPRSTTVDCHMPSKLCKPIPLITTSIGSSTIHFKPDFPLHLCPTQIIKRVLQLLNLTMARNEAIAFPTLKTLRSIDGFVSQSASLIRYCYLRTTKDSLGFSRNGGYTKGLFGKRTAVRFFGVTPLLASVRSVRNRSRKKCTVWQVERSAK